MQTVGCFLLIMTAIVVILLLIPTDWKRMRARAEAGDQYAVEQMIYYSFKYENGKEDVYWLQKLKEPTLEEIYRMEPTSRNIMLKLREAQGLTNRLFDVEKTRALADAGDQRAIGRMFMYTLEHGDARASSYWKNKLHEPTQNEFDKMDGEMQEIYSKLREVTYMDEAQRILKANAH